MNLNATLLGQLIGFIVFLFIPIFGCISFYLCKRKTQTPILGTIVGIFLAFIPPLALIYIAVLVLKNDLPKDAENL